MNAVIISIYKQDNLFSFKNAFYSIDRNSVKHVYIGIDGPVNEDIYSFLFALDSTCNFILNFKRNRGLSFVLNDLLDLIYSSENSYKYVFRMDADDLSYSNRFRKQFNFMEDNPTIDILGSSADIFINNKFHSTLTKPSFHKHIIKKFPSQAPLIHPTVCFRASSLEHFRYPTNTIRYEDIALWSKLLLNNFIFHNIPESLLRYNFNSSFVNRRVSIPKAFNEWLIKANFLLKYKSINILHYIKISTILLIKIFFPACILNLIYKYHYK